MKKFTALLFFLMVAVVVAQKDYFSSIHSLAEAYKTEEDLLRNLRTYRDKLQKQLSSFKKTVTEVKDGQNLAQMDIKGYLENPINQFHLIKRLYWDFGLHLNEIYNDKILEDFSTKMEEITSQEGYPTEDELSGSAAAFIRLQEVYRLDASEIASGILAGTKISDPMSWHDCFYMGQELFDLGDQNHTQEWLREAYNKFTEKFSVETDSIEFLESMVNMTTSIYDMETAKNISDTILKVQPDHPTAKAMKDFIETLPEDIGDLVKKTEYNPSYWVSPEDFREYEAVCRDELKRTPSEMKDLHCKYASFDNPFLKLAPFRLEILNNEPPVVMFHNVISDEEISHIKNKSISDLSISLTGSTNDNKDVRSLIRTSHSTFYDYFGDPSLVNMIQRVEDMTRQTIKESEALQVANYGMGGHYEPHYDCFKENDIYLRWEESGNRISTAMFYVSDVDLGGSTAFPFLRLNVKPVKGSMVFWYNLHASGRRDYRSGHAGCPVIKGSKWIFNIWMRVKPQMFHRKCELEDDTWKSEHLNDKRF